MPPEERIRQELHGRGVRFARVQLRENRTRLLTVGQGGATLHLHAALAEAPDEVLAAVAEYCSSRQRRKRARAARAIRDFVAGVRPAPPPARRRGRCGGSVPQRERVSVLYAELNRERFGGRLPADVPLRISTRMRSRLGHFVPRQDEDGTRGAGEIALNRRLLEPSREPALRETLLHEMAHLEAWLLHASRRHDRSWRECARRAGCRPRACFQVEGAGTSEIHRDPQRDQVILGGERP